MSLTSTARDRFVNTQPFSLKTMTVVVAGLAIVVWIGIAISGAETPDTAGTVSSNSLTHEEFVRVNTTDLPALSGVRAAVEPAANSPASSDTGATAVARSDFLYINTEALDGIASTRTEPPHRPSGPR